MSLGIVLGFIGDSMTFLGGIILAIDAIAEERSRRSKEDWNKTITSPELAEVVITRDSIKLRGKDDVELSFIRRSARRAACGALVLSLGFACLLASRVVESRNHSKCEPVAVDTPP